MKNNIQSNIRTALVVATACIATAGSTYVGVRAITNSAKPIHLSFQEVVPESTFVRDREDIGLLINEMESLQVIPDTLRDPMVPYEPPVEEESVEEKTLIIPKPWIWPRDMNITCIMVGDSDPKVYFECRSPLNGEEVIKGMYSINDTIPGTDIKVSFIDNEGIILEKGDLKKPYAF